MSLASTIDLHRALAWLATVNEERDVAAALAPTALLLRATVHALREVPELAAVRHGDRLVPAGGLHLILSVPARAGSLVTATVLDADRLDLDALTDRLRQLAAGAGAGAPAPEAAPAGGVAVTALADDGVETVFPTVASPRVAAVGFGAIVERPLSIGGEIVAGPVCAVTLVADADAVDAHRAARFLAVVDRRLQGPETL